MNDYLRAAVKFLPFVTAAVVAAAFILPVLRQSPLFGPRSEDAGDRATVNRLPAKGYAYHINKSASVLICPGWFGSYRVYPLRGDPPSGTELSNDRYGCYFSVYAGSAEAAERELDQLYLGGRGL